MVVLLLWSPTTTHLALSSAQQRCATVPLNPSFSSPSLLLRPSSLRIQSVNKDHDSNAAVQAEQAVEALEARLGVRRRERRDNKPKDTLPKLPNKDWESMTLVERAWEVYSGEKGILFWLNKVAFASIFVVIGGWIFFRFLGPALGWYQLESPLFPPS